MRSLRSLLLPSVVLVLGCKTKCPDPGRSGDDLVDRDTVTRLQKAGEKDPTVCKALGHPRVSLTGPNLVLSGTKDHDLASRASLPTNELKRIDPLFDRLKDFRELWKNVHSPNEFPGGADVLLDPDLETARALSVLVTTTFAGFPNVHVVVGATTLDFTWVVPRPPLPDEADEMKETFTVTAASNDGKAFDVKLSSSKCADTATTKVTTKATTKATSTDVPAAVTAVCAGHAPCPDVVRIVVPGAPHFGDVAKLAHDVLAAMPAPKPRLTISANATNDTASDALSAEMKAFGLPTTDDPCKAHQLFGR